MNADTHVESANSWVCGAARWPLAFAQVREDPRLDLAVLRRLRAPADVVMIASGGETAVCIAREPVRSVTLVDVNPAQLALCRLKLLLAGTVTPARSMALLGHADMGAEERGTELARYCEMLGIEEDTLGPRNAVAALGPDHAGRYELLFARLREELAPCQDAMMEMLHSREGWRDQVCTESGALIEAALREALERVMALPNLVALFGREATQNPRQEFHKHFLERLQRGMAEHAPAGNPFLWQMLEGTFPPGACYDWLESDAPLRVAPRCIQGRMSETLAAMPEASADFVHLSNILDWLSEAEASECLRRAARVLRPGGAVLVRQLNSTLAVRELPCGLQWDAEFGEHLHARDRSFFYHAIHVGFRP